MIASPLLEHLAGYAAGRWLASRSSPGLAVHNPATGESLAMVSASSDADVRLAIDQAAAVVTTPAPLRQRRAWLEAIAQRLLGRQEELARLIALENGKPLRESRAEVEYAAGFFNFFAATIEFLEPRELPAPIRGCAWTVRQRPAGVVGLITPWNFPLAMLAKKLAAALGAGCAVVAKPAEQTPLTAIAFWHLLGALDLPPGLANLVLGDPAPIGRVLCTHPAVRVVSFTGSTEVGKLLAAQGAPHLKRLTLELGGNAPFLVFADAPLEPAADALLANKFRAGGQTCVCANRVLVQREVCAAFADRVAERVRRLRVGDGLSADTDVGPLIDRAAFDKVASHVADALARGARRLVGFDPPRPAHEWGAFYPPTVLVDVTRDMRLCREETFGPVVAIAPFDSETEALALANGTGAGLAAYLFTADGERAERAIQQLEFGHVGWNTATGPTPEAPFGGFKQSGYGREGGLEGLLEFCEPQTVPHALPPGLKP